MPQISAGLLMYRRSSGGLELFLAHPGGPFWKNKDTGAWSIPKGVVEEGEDLLATAIREFHEEAGIVPQGPYHSLGSIKQKAGKVIHAWAFEGNADPASIVSNTMRVMFPPKSGRWITVPEVDRCQWFSPPGAKQKINPAQAELIERLEKLLS
jgi:predicted NUDIX family NTP pyrophosphohydrolase